tara:strand:+ start:2834 stop:3301 length:468 start_codon:yes stop_codon:yes gene_type:complete
MRESTSKRLVEAAKAALISSGLKEQTTKRQANNGTTSWLCDETGYEYAEYPSGYIRRINVGPSFKHLGPNVYQINPRVKTVNTLPAEWIHHKGRVRFVKELVEESHEHEMINEQHGRLLYILAFSQRKKDLRLKKQVSKEKSKKVYWLNKRLSGD